VARQPKIVDIEPAGRFAGCRRLIVPLLVLVVGGAAVWYYQFRPQKRSAPPVEAADVRSNVEQDGDSLRVVVDWRLVMPRGPEVAESARVEVGVNDGEFSQVASVPANEHSDTLRVPAPAPGQTASGYSCVAPMTRGRLARENCTPWQYVRPSAGQTQADSAPVSTKEKTPQPAARVSRIEVQPAGIQVDLDVGGKCARWQRENPGRSVWITVNQQAVPECTGPNGKPTVAQFCAFAVLADGRRVKTVSSEKEAYCEQLFVKWSEERTA
jgi:hypothetical protein